MEQWPLSQAPCVGRLLVQLSLPAWKGAPPLQFPSLGLCLTLPYNGTAER